VADFVFDPSYTKDCGLVRPDWSSDDGRASSILEFPFLLATPLGIAWLARLILLLWTRNGVIGAMFAVVCLALAARWELLCSLNDDLYLG
jgi:hypothetical protein